MTELSVAVDPAPTMGLLRVLVDGEVDLSVCDRLFADLDRAVDLPGVDMVEVDLSRVTILDAAAVGVLLAARHAAACRGRGLRVCGATGLPLYILEITGVAGLLGGKYDSRPAGLPAADHRGGRW
jgi:anti-anti-sigma regulatory factor